MGRLDSNRPQLSNRPNFLDQDPALDLVNQTVRPENSDSDAVRLPDETTEEARTRVSSQARRTTTNAVENLQSVQQDPDEAVRNLENRSSILRNIQLANDLYIEDDVVSESPEYEAAQHRYFRNLSILEEEIEETSRKYDEKGWFGYTLDFVDREILRATLFGWAEQLTNRTARQGSRVWDVMVNESDPQAMRRFAREFIADAESEGVLTGENVFAFNQMVREVYSGGHNPDAVWDAAFGVLDLAGFGGVVAGTARRATRLASLRAVTPAQRAGAAGNVSNANSVAAKLDNADIDPRNTANMQSSSLDPNSGVGAATPVRPSNGATLAVENSRRLLDSETAKGAVPTFGRIIDETVAGGRQALATKAMMSFARKFSLSVYDTVLKNVDLNTSQVTFRIGKAKDGTPFAAKKNGQPPKAAWDLAARVNGDVVRVDPEDISKGFVVDVAETLDLGSGVTGRLDIKLSRNLWQKTLGAILDNRFVGSASTQDVAELNALALRAQAASKFLNNVGAKAQQRIDSLNATDRITLDAVLTELRDGTKSTDRLAWRTEDFKATWASKNAGEVPSADVIRAFEAARDLSDAAYFFRALQVMNTFVRKGFKNTIDFSDGFRPAAKRLTKEQVPSRQLVKNLEDGKVGFIDEVPDGVTVWELASPSGPVKYAYNALDVKAISPEDALGFSAYGRRTNPLSNYFVFVRNSAGSAKTILGAFSAKTAATAMSEFQAIFKAYADNLTDEAFEEVLSNNNTWNSSITTRAQMDEWLDENGIDLEDIARVETKMRDQPIDDATDAIFGDEDAYSFVNNQMSRRDAPLTEYGGGHAYNPDPIDSITSDFGSAAHQYANAVYTQKAATSWIEEARILSKENVGVRVDFNGINPLDYRKAIIGATIEGTSEQAKRLRDLQAIIKNRMNVRSAGEEFLKQKFGEIAEAVYDSWGLRISMNDPQAKVLSFGFFSAFAFNLSQALMQGSQIINITAITGARVGFTAAAGQLHLRKILFGADDIATENLAMEGFAKFLEMPVDEAREFADLFRIALPNVVASDIIEHGTTASANPAIWRNVSNPAMLQAKRFGRKMLDLGMVPFNLGESTSKSTAYFAAALEYKRKFPNQSILTEKALNTISARAETLTQNMSNASRAGLQYGLGRVPTQWLSYLFRSSEQVFIGRDLTARERVRLGFFLFPFYGTTGMGVGFAAEKIAEWWGLDPNKEEDVAKYIALKNGVIDGFLNYYTPFDVALAERLAIAPGVYDIYEKLRDENVFSAFGGPSGSIAYGGIEALFNLGSAIYNGEATALNEDSLRVLRNFSGVNNIVKAAGIMQDGIYRNRRGLALPLEMSISDAIISITGFTPIEVSEYYNQMGRYYDLNSSFRSLRTEVLEKSRLAWSIYPENPQRASDILRDINILIDKAAPLSYTRQQELRRLALPRYDSTDPILQTLIDNQMMSEARWANSIMNRN